MLGNALQRIAIVETGTQVGQFRTSGEQVGGNLPQGIAAVESLGKGRHTGERSLGPGRGYRFERSTSVKSILHFSRPVAPQASTAFSRNAWSSVNFIEESEGTVPLTDTR